MKCPRCGFVSFEYLDDCRKCGTEMLSHKESYDIEMERAQMLPILAYHNRQQEKKRADSENLAQSSIIEEDVAVAETVAPDDLPSLTDEEISNASSFPEEEVISIDSLTGDNKDETGEGENIASSAAEQEDDEPSVDIQPEDISLDLSDITDPDPPVEVDVSFVEDEVSVEPEVTLSAEDEVNSELETVEPEPEEEKEAVTVEETTSPSAPALNENDIEEISLEDLQLTPEPKESGGETVTVEEAAPPSAPTFNENDIEEISLEDLQLDVEEEELSLEVLTEDADDNTEEQAPPPPPADTGGDEPALSLSLESSEDADKRIQETLSKKEEVKIDTSLGKLEIERE